MNATVAPSSSAVTTREPVSRPGRYLYIGLGLLLAAIIFAGFTRTYLAPLSAGRVNLHPVIHIHAALFFLWTVMFVGQGVLAAVGRIDWHRQLGLLGIAVAGAMVFSGLLAAVVTVQQGLGSPREVIVRSNTGLSLGAMLMFSTFMVLAIANLGTPERHKRFIVLAMFSILQAAVARFFIPIAWIDYPTRTLLGAAVVDVILLSVIALDARYRGRVSRVYVGGAIFIVLIQYLRRAVLEMQWWDRLIHWMASLGT